MTRFGHRQSGLQPSASLKRAFTLVELVVAVAIMSVILVAVGSTIVLASKALPDANSPIDRSILTADIVDQMANELHLAVTIDVATENAIEFDVIRAGQERTIRYEWSGTAGDPLTRQYDNGPVVNVLDNVQDFVLACNGKASDRTEPTESGEIMLLDNRASASDAFAIDSSHWVGQYFEPSLPADATGWRVTRALIRAQTHGPANGLTNVQIRPADASNLPTTTVLAEQVMAESALTSSFTDQEFSFSDAGELTPGDGACLVLQWDNDKHSADICYNSSSGSGLVDTSNGGGGWNSYPAQQLYCAIWGTYTSEQAVDSNIVESVSIHIVSGSVPAVQMDTEALTLNNPELP